MNALEVSREETVKVTVAQNGSTGRKIKGVRNLFLKTFFNLFNPFKLVKKNGSVFSYFFKVIYFS